MQIGKTLKEIRTAKGVSLTELAELSNVTKSYLSKIENDKREPSVTSIHSVCKALGVPLNIVILLAEEPEHDDFFELNNQIRALARQYVIQRASA